jgi:hypothetical protein
MRKALTTSILLLALCGSAYAGNMPTDTPTPPQLPATANVTTEPTGEPTDVQATEVSMTEIGLSILQSVLSVF